jgi:hypothetical protein
MWISVRPLIHTTHRLYHTKPVSLYSTFFFSLVFIPNVSFISPSYPLVVHFLPDRRLEDARNYASKSTFASNLPSYPPPPAISIPFSSSSPFLPRYFPLLAHISPYLLLLLLISPSLHIFLSPACLYSDPNILSSSLQSISSDCTVSFISWRISLGSKIFHQVENSGS